MLAMSCTFGERTGVRSTTVQRGCGDVAATVVATVR
jgi:hypothetical protein